MKTVCVYCGSSSGTLPVFGEAALRLADILVERGLELVYGGGRVGLMGALADRVLERGGRVTGVIPQALMTKEVGHQGLTDLRVVGSMHERKALMEALADGFVALPGGLGTMEELCEMLTWGQLGLHRKPCGLLDVDGYYGPFLAWLDGAIGRGFISPEHRALLVHATTPDDLLDDMTAWKPIAVPKWIDTEET